MKAELCLAACFRVGGQVDRGRLAARAMKSPSSELLVSSSGFRRGPGRLGDPVVILAVGGLLVALCEYGREQVRHPVSWTFVEVAISTVSLALVWRRRERLRLAPLLGAALLVDLAWIVAGLHSSLVFNQEYRYYASLGHQLLSGHYPPSEWPPGAVSLFAIESWLGGARTHAVNAAILIPFQLMTVAGIWSLRMRWSPWFAAVVAAWPVNSWFWQYRFDLLPAGLLVAGLALASRRRWGLAGLVLGLGASAKWSPALALPTLAVYLLVSRQRRSVMRLTLGFVVALAVTYLPYLVWSPTEVLSAYRFQAGRRINDESIWHLPLHALGLESRHDYTRMTGGSVGPPSWANTVAIAVQILVLLALVYLVSRARSLKAAIAIASLMPVVFLTTNRVFSVQYFVLLFAAWLVAAALLARDGRDALAASVAALAATIANALIVPYGIHEPGFWQLLSAARFGLALALTAWLVWIAVWHATPDRDRAELVRHPR
jgi:hypothetical protein